MVSDTKLNPLLAALVRILFKPKVHYLDPSRKDEIFSEPSILVANHTGHLDGGIINTALRKYPIHTLAAKDRFEQPGFGFLLRHTGCIPIDRQNMDTTWIHDSLAVLKDDKEHVAIYPEGRHGEHRKQLPFQPGVAMLAAIAKVPIVMVYQDGPARKFHRSHLIVAPPFHLEEGPHSLRPEIIQEQTELLEKKMKELMEAYIKMTETEEKK
jgi:1-acyl-sn-glycerol-3-phosphate acyltransferase